jgi:outer membrane protein OmpA-like peptidoglycan-associated protein
MYDYYDDEPEGRSWGKIVGIAAAVVALGIGATMMRSGNGSDDKPEGITSQTDVTESSRPSQSSSAGTGTIDNTTTTRVESLSPAGSTTSTGPDRSASTTQPQSVASYPTLPDGSPAPLLLVYDVDVLSLDGEVRSQEAKDRIATLALANSKNPESEVVNRLEINPEVPDSIGVRVIDLTSTRFGEGSAVVDPAYAREVDRVATVMNAFPAVTVLVVGHADQRGDSNANYRLSLDRAQAAVDYLVFMGIDPSRLAARAVGENDLLTLDDDDAALALNRRTEFTFYGILTGF